MKKVLINRYQLTYPNKEMRTTKPENWKLSSQLGRDMHSGTFVEATCEHGVGHHRGTHGCDGCCFDMPEDIKNQTTQDE